MNDSCTIQLFHEGHWRDIAEVTLFDNPKKGWRAKTYTGYSGAWVLDHMGRRDAHAMGSRFPVSFAAVTRPHWPVFLFDMLPQDYGRGELLRQLGLSETAAESVEWRLLLAGAGNPVGHLRVKEAAEWLAEKSRLTAVTYGFSDEEVAQRSDNFIEYLGGFGLFVAGSSGVQGEWPKILLTRAADGLLYLDHTVPDSDALEHFIVKFGRGADIRLAQILENEAPYMAIARHLGLRVFAPLMLRDRALFIPRFDRRVTDTGVVRMAQESLAVMLEVAGFDRTPSHDDAVQRLMQIASDPQTEVLEYLRRDVANLALCNKDNHARNTALQRDFDGNIALTPLFDFAPMYLHPDGIARRMRWTDNDAGAPDWLRVIDQVIALSQMKRRNAAGVLLDRDALIESMLAMVAPLDSVAAHGTDFGLSADVHSFLIPHIKAQCRALARLESAHG